MVRNIRFWGLCCGARSAALTFPPAPFLSRAAGEEGGGSRPHTFALASVRSPTRSGRGDHAPAPSPSPLSIPHCGSVAMAILRLHLATMPHLRTQSPLSRSAGEGLGVRAPQDLAFSATGDRYPGSGTSTTTPSLLPTRSPGCAGRWLARAVNDWNPSGSASAPHYPRHLASTLPTSFRLREG